MQEKGMFNLLLSFNRGSKTARIRNSTGTGTIFATILARYHRNLFPVSLW
jgi:hypothetical protein